MRWNGMIGVVVAMLATACTINTGGSTGSSSGGMSPGIGSGGGGGGGGASCSSICAHIAAAGCASPTEDECMSSCQQAAQACPSEAQAAASCIESETVTCDAQGNANVADCTAALDQCGNGGGGSGGGSGSGGMSSSGSGSGSGGGNIPPGGACSESGASCEPITCTCRDGAIYGPLSLCDNGECAGTSDGCPMLCGSDGGY